MRPYTEAEKRWLRLFRPCKNGVHVLDPDGEFGGVTVANFPRVDLVVFRELSSAGDGDDFDLICDLYQDGSITDNVTIRRQDLALIERKLAARLPDGGADHG